MYSFSTTSQPPPPPARGASSYFGKHWLKIRNQVLQANKTRGKITVFSIFRFSVNRGDESL
jgi:hypothetical protein